MSSKDNFNCSYCNQSFWDWTQYNSTIQPNWETALKSSALIVISVLGLFSNFSILMIVYKNKLLRHQPANLFMTNMAVADFLCIAFCPLLYFFKQKVIFLFYHLGMVPCKMTPFLIVTFFLTGSLTLMVISLNRLFGVAFPNLSWLRLRRRSTVIWILLVIWLISVAAASPTIYFRQYWVRQWSDQVETNCDDGGAIFFANQEAFCRHKWLYTMYWLTLLGISVWLPIVVTFISYAIICSTLRKSFNLFPYLSEQSRTVRSRHRVIKILFILLVVQVVGWGPWQFYTIYDSYLWYARSDCQSSLPRPSDDIYKQWMAVRPILHDVKFYLIFICCAINPFIYGYSNETIRKAFRITFPFFFKEKPPYVMQRGGVPGQFRITFLKVVQTISRSDGGQKRTTNREGRPGTSARVKSLNLSHVMQKRKQLGHSTSCPSQMKPTVRDESQTGS